MIITHEIRAKLIADLKKKQAALAGTSNENDNIATLVGALPLMRLIIAWPLIKLNVPNEPIEVPDELPESQKIWAGVTLDFEEAAIAARIPMTYIELHVREAQLHCWVLPDGTVAENALKLAKTTIARLAKGEKKGN